jgi:Transposase DDE domain
LGVQQNQTPSIAPFLPHQGLLSPHLPEVQGNAEYQERVEMLGFLEDLLRRTPVEAEFLALCMQRFLSEAEAGTTPSLKDLERHQTHSLLALRTMVLKSLLQETFRGLSLQLAQSPLLRKFCLCDTIAVVKVPSKSELQRYSQWLPHEQMREVIDHLTRAAVARTPGAGEALGLECVLELDVLLIDSTCLAADIHFPVDWVLLRDAVRTLMKTILWARNHGLKNRMEAPEAFLSRINALCMEMAQAGKAFVADSKNKRKAVLRKMKKVVNAVEGHARAYRKLLDEQWKKTEVSRGRVDAVLRRMDNILGQLPAAKRQAHERIIGERQVPNTEKILSFYEADVHVMVRGKASGEIEFGNSLLICEQSDGFIVDFELRREAPKADVKCLEGSIARVEELGCGPALAVVADRGFDSKENREFLARHDLFNGLCPRGPKELERRKKEEIFGACQKRRAQTEARVATLKNVFIGERCRGKGFESRQAQVDWAVLTHNLRLLAQMRQREKAAKAKELAAA